MKIKIGSKGLLATKEFGLFKNAAALITFR
jgi:hypothetical protein